MTGKYAALREAMDVAEARLDEARLALDVAEQVVAPRPERRAVDEAYARWEQALADLEAALIEDCRFKVGEVYRSRTGVVATIVSHSADTTREGVITWGRVHKKNGKIGVSQPLWTHEWVDALKIETEVAA